MYYSAPPQDSSSQYPGDYKIDRNKFLGKDWYAQIHEEMKEWVT